ncbi:MAG: valine--tRNA ligase [Alphaproteobacteria bacterium]|nr:valine--tRNA ligase [Alphaproteobacteria bacterium]
MQQIEMDKYFEPAEAETKWYRFWEENGYFHTERDAGKTPYTIMIPPPNITGKLHIGHALNMTLQDVTIRMKRMQGYSALWVPGTDHASIATEAKIVDMLKKEGLTKDALGREGFLKRAWEWRDEYGGTIIKQLKKLGSSCDWKRERFTLDEGLSQAVRKVFIDMYNEGLIYRGERLVNWCPCCHTSISDAEVEYEEEQGSLWYIRYDSPDKSYSVEVATTRPETMLGDTAVAVNPKDERFAHMIGKTVVVPIVNREIPVIADPFVEMEFGTGAVKITPAHDFNDFAAGKKFGLEIIKVIDEDGKMLPLVEKYAGQDILTARNGIVEELKTLGCLTKIEPYMHKVGKCYRCHHTVEPLISKQWFVKMESLAKPAIQVVKDKEITIIPERDEKVYCHWMENIQDWCISRQLWWGHRIPAYYCTKCGAVHVGESMPTEACSCGHNGWVQDEDTLDTWFSSALWPFSTLGWPTETEDLKYFYPTTTLITGRDIIFFWVARMIFSGLKQTGKVPFKKVVMHGLVRDALGRKMSKSLNNGVDPLEAIAEFGADALRFSLIQGLNLETDIKYSTDKLTVAKAFINKLWNSAKFVFGAIADTDFQSCDTVRLQPEDKWMITKLNGVIQAVTEELDKFEYGLALQKLYDFFWNDFCSTYIEMIKPRLMNEGAVGKAEAAHTLYRAMVTVLKLLHPFLPFVTEELYAKMNDGHKEPLIITKWPVATDENYSADYENIELLKSLISGIRNVRANMNIQPNRKTNLIVVTATKADFIQNATPILQKLAFAKEVFVQPTKDGIPTNAVTVETVEATVYIPFEDLVDVAAEIERLTAEKAKYQELIDRVDRQLSNEQFVAKAPKAKVDEQRQKRADYQKLLAATEERLAALNK